MKNTKLVWTFLLLVISSVLGYNFYPETELLKTSKVDYILVNKSKRELSLFSKGQLVKTYKIALGKNPIGRKEVEGDKKTPEGIYYISDKNPKSGYYKNVGVSYPNAIDIERAKRLKKPTGGSIKIHGLRNGIGFIGKLHRYFDWTLGCIAVTNKEMDELYEVVEVGTKIEIKP